MSVQDMLTIAVRWAVADGVPVGVPTDGFGVTLVCSEFGRKWLRTEGPVDAAAALLLQLNPPLRVTTPRSMPWLQFYDALSEATGVSPGEAVDLLWTSAADAAAALSQGRAS